MIGNKIADKIKSVSKKPAMELHSKELHNHDETKEKDVEIATPKKRYISPEERKQIIEELRLVPKKYVWIKVNIKRDNKLFINQGQYYNIIMEYQKIANLLGSAWNQPSKFGARNWIKINDE